MGIKEIIVVCSAVGVLCFGAGYYTKMQFDRANQFEAVTQARKTDAKNVQQSVATSVSVEATVAASTSNINRIRDQVAILLKSKGGQNAPAQTSVIRSNAVSDHDATASGGDGCTLDAGTVRLLNAARAGIDSPASGSDGESETASATAVADIATFVDNDLRVVGLYHELATRHDELVDYVSELVKAQTE